MLAGGERVRWHAALDTGVGAVVPHHNTAALSLEFLDVSEAVLDL